MKLDELKRLEENGQYRKAYKVLECLDIKKIKSTKDIFIVIDVLIENDRFDQALNTLIELSKKLKTRRVIHQITDVAIKSGKVEIAKQYMKEFRKIAPQDPYNYVFEYQMAVLEDQRIEKQIEILEELKQYEYMEKWAYELAKVYHRANMDENCVAECNDIILWFSEGIYVEKAKVLRQYLIDATIPEDLYSGHYHKTESVPIEVEEEEKEEEVQIEQTRSPASEPVFPGKARPSYQSAFDFIERMETEEKEREIDEIIERVEQKNQDLKKCESSWQESPVVEEESFPMEEVKLPTEEVWQEEQKEQEEVEEVEVEKEYEEKQQGVEQFAQKRRQRATTKRLNEMVREVLGKECDAISYLGTFGKIHTIGEEIITSLISLREKTQQDVIVVIEGGQSDAKRLLIEKLIKLYSDLGIIHARKVGVFKEEQLRSTSFEDYAEKLKDSCLVISPLTSLEQPMFEQIRFLNKIGCFIMVDLEESCSSKVREAIKEKLTQMAEIVTIHQNPFNEEELLGFANDFIESKEYTLEPDAKEYLEKVVQELIENGDADAFSKIMGKTANAYHCANARNKVELRDIAESGRYKDANFMSIRVNDFADENKAI